MEHPLSLIFYRSARRALRPAPVPRLPRPLVQPAALLPGLLTLACGAVLLFANLDYALLEPDESRYAELPRLMDRTGDWLTPKLEGKPYNDKPPLVYWLVAAGYRLFGTQAWVGRAVCAAAGCLTLLAVYFWCRRELGEPAATLGVFVLQTMIGFVILSRMLLLDSVLSAAVVGGWLAGHLAICRGHLRWNWWLVSAACVGIGVLAKGPVAGVLVAPVLLAYRWLDRGSVRWGPGPALAFAGVVAAIALPWYAVMLATNEAFARDHLWRHHVMRFLEPFHHAKPFWYYGPFWFGEVLPWAGVMIFALARWRSWPPAVRFAALASIWTFFFFSASKGKLPTYLLPLLPMNAIVLGWSLACWLQEEGAGRRLRLTLAAGLAILIAALALKEPLALHLFGQEYDEFALLPLAFVPLLVLGVAFRTRAFGLACLLLAGLGVSAQVAWHALPDYADEASRGQPAAAMARWAEAQGWPVVAFRNAWPGASFYRQADELPVFHKEDEAKLWDWLRQQPGALVLMRHEEDQLRDFIRAIPPSHQVVRVLNRPTVYGVAVGRRE